MIKDTIISKGRIFYLDVLRVIATFFVIIIHVAGFSLGDVEFKSIDWEIINIFYSLTSCAVPIFVMVSGALFLNPKKDISIEIIFKKYIFRILIVFIFWSLFYSLLSNINVVLHENIRVILPNLLESFFIGHFHLWFLYMIIGLYVTVPILKLIVSNKLICEYFILISIITVGVLPLIQKLELFEFTTVITKKMNLNLFLGFVGYFIAGFYFVNYQIEKKLKYSLLFLAVLSMIISVLSMSFLSINANNTVIGVYDNLNINTMLVASALFILVKEIFGFKLFKNSFIKLINEISNVSFGIYLIHVFYLSILFKLKLHLIINNTVISIICITFLVFLLSYLTVKVIRNIPYIGKRIT